MDNFELWYRANRGSESQISGEPPLAFNSNGKPITNWSITGSSGGVGEKTANLVPPGWAEDFVTRIDDSTKAKIENDILTVAASAGYGEYDTKYIFKTDWKENTPYTLTYTARRDAQYPTNPIVAFYYTDGTRTFIPFAMVNDGEWYQYSGASTSTKTVKYIAAYWTQGLIDIDTNSFNVNEGTEPIIEPYGYKIPIICGGETTNIYLDTPLYDGEQIIGTQTGVSIPTISGSNTLTIDTLVQPSSVSIAVSSGINKNLFDYLHYRYIVARQRGE